MGKSRWEHPVVSDSDGDLPDSVSSASDVAGSGRDGHIGHAAAGQGDAHVVAVSELNDAVSHRDPPARRQGGLPNEVHVDPLDAVGVRVTVTPPGARTTHFMAAHQS
jgi:hypothetical protein